MAKFDNILGTVGNTPIVRINKIAPPHVKVYVKVEAFNPLGSVKDRLALGIIEDAERRGTLKPGQTVVEATSGNTGIGLAMVCAQKGYPLVVTMAESFSLERRRMMRFLGAKVVLTPAAKRGSGMLAKAVELAEKHGWFLARQFENEANPDMHSRTTAREILADFKGERLDYFVTGYGTGGTFKGVARVLREERPETRIVLCEPDNAQLVGSGVPQQRDASGVPSASHPNFQPHPMQGWTADFIPKLTGDAIELKLADRIQPVSGVDAMRLSRELAQKEGIFVGISSGATLAGGLKVAADAPEGTVILCMLPDTGERYLSTPLFADIPTDMTEEELEISRSTPNYRFDAPPPAAAPAAPPAASAPPSSAPPSAPPSTGAAPATNGANGAAHATNGANGAAADAQSPAAFVEAALHDPANPVVMFALEWCEFCGAVRKLFARYGIPYRSVDIDSVAYQDGGRGLAIRAALTAKTSIPTIPQVFIGGKLIGGSSDVVAAWKAGQLQPLLDKAGVVYRPVDGFDVATLMPNWVHPR